MNHDTRKNPLPDQPTSITRLTASLPAAIATLGVSGPNAISYVNELIKLQTSKLQIGRVHYGELQLGSSLVPVTEHAPEQVVVCRTAEQLVEISCHGGSAVCEAIIGKFQDAGCRRGSATDWSQSPKTRLQCEAETDLLRARTDRAAAILLDQYSGALDSTIARVLESIHPSVGPPATVDQSTQDASRETLGLCRTGNSEDDSDSIAHAAAMLNELLQSSQLGLRLADGFRIVFAGPPNVGKSSLTNELIGSDKAIVHETAGTTRDWIEFQAALDGWPISITDTAGIRDTRDDIERQGIEHARRQLEMADLAILLVDATSGWTATHQQLCATAGERSIVVINKSDLVELPPELPAGLAHVRRVDISCQTGFGLDALQQAIVAQLVPLSLSAGQAVLFRQAQVDICKAALECLRAQDRRAASELLRQLIPSWTSRSEPS